ncbi:RGM domain family member B-like [Acipenser oxyrinchus oxyrinchus]|uniref:RGM domain family member B-like n=1 Tax=Acipenser oxyrinchus oxyrinchus TaxID=40147 RepID=A0AAD8GHK1_ACIOX|nr:RGM domain family member B-like [Acipenser oxyrinchus oxyrinchus]
MGMGKAGFYYPGAERLRSPPPVLTLLVLIAVSSWVHIGECQPQATQCRISKCTSDFVSLTSHLNSALDGFDTEFCKALRAYSACTHRNTKTCRGNLVYHSAVLGISDLMMQRNCSKDGPTSSTQPETAPESCNYHSRHHGSGREFRAGDPGQPTYLFCGLFGDPHLRTFKDQFQTCKVEGAWPLIDNNYLSVQVTNVPVVPGSTATATNKITIIFKPYQECTEQKVYQAVTDDLPAAFVDGTTSGGDGDTKSLRIVEKEAGQHAEIHARYIGATVIVRQVGRYLTLAVRMPEELALAYDETQDLQLCMNGCPMAERIDEDGYLPLPVLGLHHPKHQHQHQHHQQQQPHNSPQHPHGSFSLGSATAKCREKLKVKDIYFHSCVFDLLTTGDANFTSAAYSALQDLEALHPQRERWHIFPNQANGGPCSFSHTPVFKLGLLCFIIVLFL